MKRFYTVLSFCLFLFLLLAPLSKVHAEVIFEDNFNSYPNGSFPSKWVEVIPSSTCTVTWRVINGEANSRINNVGSCTGNIMPNDEVWPTLMSNYVFEADVRFGVGVDHNLVYKIVPSSSSIYEMHFGIPGNFSTGYPPNTTLFANNQTYFTGINYHIKVIVEGKNTKFYIDGNLIREIEFNEVPPPGKIALRIGTGSNPNSETWFDNVRVTTLNHTDSVLIGVPLLKQTSSPWNDDLYDSADLWANDSSFERWGCAVTSAAMIFNYYGLNQMKGGSLLDPGSLNKWLKSQPDGYIGNGNTNWLALTRLSKQISGLNGVDFDAFEFSRAVSSDHQMVKDWINGGIPSILRVPNHFVVSRGYTDDNVLINDPYYDREDLTEYGNTFQNISTFTPSSTDLSYIMLTVDESVNIEVSDNEGNAVGDLVSEEPIGDPAGVASSTAKTLKIVYLPQPENGKYGIKISSDSKANYDLVVYLYDENGNVKKLPFSNSIDNEEYSYVINFDKKKNSKSIVEESVTYESLIKSIENLYKDKEIKLSAYISLSTNAKLAQAFKKSKQIEKTMLKNLKNNLKAMYKSKQVTSYANEYLSKRINILEKNK